MLGVSSHKIPLVCALPPSRSVALLSRLLLLLLFCRPCIMVPLPLLRSEAASVLAPLRVQDLGHWPITRAGARTIVRDCRGRHDDEASAGNWASSVGQQARSFLAFVSRSVGVLAPLESITHAGVQRESHPSLLTQVSNDPGKALQLLPKELDASAIPTHVAIIMDGNGRWAKRRGMPAIMGYEAGVRSLHEVIKLANTSGVKVLTVFAFSTENWLRPKIEVDFLMLLFEISCKNLLSFFNDDLIDTMFSWNKENIQVHYMGDSTLLPDFLRKTVSALEEHTKHNTGLKFCLALSYSGRYDIANACQRLAAKKEAGELNSWNITKSAIEEELKTSCLGDARDPDLLIRTSGEQRLSNFLLWQTAYTELYFVDSLWPDFGALQFRNALLAYQNRNRRFGKRN